MHTFLGYCTGGLVNVFSSDNHNFFNTVWVAVPLSLPAMRRYPRIRYTWPKYLEVEAAFMDSKLGGGCPSQERGHLQVTPPKIR